MNKPTSPVLQPGQSLATGLVRCYPLHEGSGPTLHDLATGARDATARTSGSAAPATWGVDPAQGGFITLNGTDQDAAAPDLGLPSGESPRSVAFLARTSSRSQNNAGYLLGYGDGGNGLFAVGLATPNSQGPDRQPFRATTAAHGAGGAADLVDNAWHLCVATVDPSTNLRMFVDGSLIAIDVSGSDTPGPCPFAPLATALPGTLYLGQAGGTIGAGGGPLGLYFRGDVAGYWIWERALSEAEVAAFTADPWQMVRPAAPPPPATGYTLSAPASALTGSPVTVTATLTGGGYLSSPLVISLSGSPGSHLKFGGPITISNGQTSGSTTATATKAGTQSISAAHTGGGFDGGDGSTSFVAADPPDTSTYSPYGQVFDLLAAGRSTARARAIDVAGAPAAGLDWSTAGVRDLGSGQYGVTLLLPPVPLWIQVDDGAGGPSLFDHWDGGSVAAGSGPNTGPTAAQIAAAVLSRSFSGGEPGNSIAGILGGLPTLDEYRAEVAGQIASTPAVLPANPPAAYATAAGQATAASAITSIKADTARLAGMVETTTVDGSPVDRFKFSVVVQAPAASAAVDVNAIVAAINAAGVRLRADGLDAIVVESGINARQALAVDLAASAGIVAGAGSGLITIKGAGVADTRITAATDQSGNRIRVQMDLPA